MSLFNSLIPAFARPLASRDPQAESPAGVAPAYDVQETDEAYGLTVHLPGVGKGGLEITVDGGEFRVVGRRGWKQPEGWTALYRESSDVPFELALAHDNAIDVEKIHAELTDGVLRASLPKAEALKPRKIAVN